MPFVTFWGEGKSQEIIACHDEKLDKCHENCDKATELKQQVNCENEIAYQAASEATNDPVSEDEWFTCSQGNV